MSIILSDNIYPYHAIVMNNRDEWEAFCKEHYRHTTIDNHIIDYPFLLIYTKKHITEGGIQCFFIKSEDFRIEEDPKVPVKKVEHTPRKVVQILNPTNGCLSSVVALCNDGSMFWTSSQGERWNKFKDVPQD